jgi:hypothetical protein
MSQQINLYQPEPPQSLRPLAVPVVMILVVAAVVLAYAHLVRSQNEDLRGNVRQAEAQLKAEKEKLGPLKAKLAERGDDSQVADQLRLAKAAATDAEAIVARIEAGELGTLKGYSGQLAALARTAEQGIWLTAVRIQKGGRGIALEGRALSPESVLKYTENVNRHMAPFGAQITGIDLTPVSSANGLSAMAFKLY